MPGFNHPPHPNQNQDYVRGMVHIENGNYVAAMWSFITAVEHGYYLAWKEIGHCMMKLFVQENDDDKADLNAIKIQCRSMYRRALLGAAGHENIHVDAMLLNIKSKLPPREGEDEGLG